MRILQVLIVVGILAGSANGVSAYDCKTIRDYVVQYGRKIAIAFALQQGYTMVQITAIKKACFSK